ncbi:MAG: heme exporter protein CcmD [Geminicoccaceae bacterium]
MSEILAMGGYGAYVWSAVGFTLCLLLTLFLISLRQSRRRDRELDQWRERRRQGRKSVAAGKAPELSESR